MDEIIERSRPMTESDDATRVFRDRGIDDVGVGCLSRCNRAVCVMLHKPRVARDIGDQDRR